MRLVDTVSFHAFSRHVQVADLLGFFPLRALSAGGEVGGRHHEGVARGAGRSAPGRGVAALRALRAVHRGFDRVPASGAVRARGRTVEDLIAGSVGGELASLAGSADRGARGRGPGPRHEPR